MLNAKFKDTYTNGNGNLMYIYTISGDATELKAYEDFKGEYLRHCDKTGLPLFYTKFASLDGEFKKSEKGNYYIDNSQMQKDIAVMKNLGLDPTEIFAKKFNLGNSSPAPQTQASAPQAETPPFDADEDAGDLGDM